MKRMKKNEIIIGLLYEKTHCARSGIGNSACILCPLVLLSLPVKEVSFKSSNNVLHAVHAHSRSIQDIAVGRGNQHKQKHRYINY